MPQFQSPPDPASISEYVGTSTGDLRGSHLVAKTNVRPHGFRLKSAVQPPPKTRNLNNLASNGTTEYETWKMDLNQSEASDDQLNY